MNQGDIRDNALVSSAAGHWTAGSIAEAGQKLQLGDTLKHWNAESIHGLHLFSCTGGRKVHVKPNWLYRLGQQQHDGIAGPQRGVRRRTLPAGAGGGDALPPLPAPLHRRSGCRCRLRESAAATAVSLAAAQC